MKTIRTIVMWIGIVVITVVCVGGILGGVKAFPTSWTFNLNQRHSGEVKHTGTVDVKTSGTVKTRVENDSEKERLRLQAEAAERARADAEAKARRLEQERLEQERFEQSEYQEEGRVIDQSTQRIKIEKDGWDKARIASEIYRNIRGNGRGRNGDYRDYGYSNGRRGRNGGRRCDGNPLGYGRYGTPIY